MRRKSRRKEDLALTPTLPDELLVKILLNLPVRSLLRCKCVCKSWHSLISDPEFGKSHFDLNAAPTHRLLLRCTHFYIESIDLDASLHDEIGVAYLPLPLPSPPSPRRRDFGIDRTREHHEILGSCRGFILLYYESGDLILWNPSTGAYRRVSNSCSHLSYEFLYGFVYDASLDDYAVVLMEFYNPKSADPGWLEYISFKSESYNYVEDVNVRYKDMGYEFRAASLLNGFLHWLVFSEEKQVPLIVAFDLVGRSLSEISLPHDLTIERKYELYGLRVMNECLALCCSVKGCGMDEIWVLKEYKAHSSWYKSFVIFTFEIPHNHFLPIWVTKDGRIFGSNSCGRLEKLNDKGEILEHLLYSRTRGCYWGNLQSAMYRESLLPLPSVAVTDTDREEE